MVPHRLTPVKMAENPVRAIPIKNRSGPAPGELVALESGA